MQQPSDYTKFDSLQLWLAKYSLPKRAVLIATTYTIVLMVIFFLIFLLANGFTLPDRPLTTITLTVGTALFVGIVFGALYPVFYKLQINKLRSSLHVNDLQPIDMVELRIWFRSGRLPSNERLHDKLSFYLEYLRPFIEGRQLYSSKALGRIIIIIAGFNAALAAFNLFNGSDFSITKVVNLVIWLGLLALYLSFYRKKGSPIRILNRSSLKRFKNRERELA